MSSSPSGMAPAGPAGPDAVLAHSWLARYRGRCGDRRGGRRGVGRLAVQCVSISRCATPASAAANPQPACCAAALLRSSRDRPAGRPARPCLPPSRARSALHLAPGQPARQQRDGLRGEPPARQAMTEGGDLRCAAHAAVTTTAAASAVDADAPADAARTGATGLRRLAYVLTAAGKDRPRAAAACRRPRTLAVGGAAGQASAGTWLHGRIRLRQAIGWVTGRSCTSGSGRRRGRAGHQAGRG